ENLDQPTLITAVNNAGVIHAFILPGGQTTHASTLEADERGLDPDGRQPALLNLEDLNGDGTLDLTITLGDTGVVLPYIQDRDHPTFRLPTDDQRAGLLLRGSR